MAVAILGVGHTLRRSPVRGTLPERFVAYAARKVADTGPARLPAELEELRALSGTDLAVVNVGGEVLARGGNGPAVPLTPEERSRADRGPIHLARRLAFAARVPGSAPPAYLVMTGEWGRSETSRVLLSVTTVLAAVLLVLALGSIPVTRAISAPITRLTRVARALGEGDLSVRAGIRRGDEVGELSRTFDEMAERLQRLVRSEKELLANVSHELRTPIARIRVALELAAEGDQERARRYLADIGVDLAELEQLLEGVLVAARLELAPGVAPELPLHRERLPAVEILQRAAQRFREAHPDRSLVVDLPVPPPAVDADAALLRRALENLLDNARKYSEPEHPIQLSARASDGRLQVEVRDHGIGIETADLPRLFTPFFRTDRSRARGTGGVGLGLALARRVVEAHGGELSVESEPGRGTVVRFSLPLA